MHQQAGFKNVCFQYEPIAAAFAHEQKINSEKLACVIDIGGGTSDFTVIRLSPENRNKADRPKTFWQIQALELAEMILIKIYL